MSETLEEVEARLTKSAADAYRELAGVIENPQYPWNSQSYDETIKKLKSAAEDALNLLWSFKAMKSSVEPKADKS